MNNSLLFIVLFFAASYQAAAPADRDLYSEKFMLLFLDRSQLDGWRPILRKMDNALQGYVLGFASIDLHQPLFAVSDGVHEYFAVFKVTYKYMTSFDPDIFVNVIDTLVPMITYANIKGSGLTSLALFQA